MKKKYTHKNTRFLFPALLAVLMLFGAGKAVGQGSETFENSTAIGTGSYSDDSFVGDEGFTWTFGHSRDEGDYPIDGKGLMLRRASDSYLEAVIPGGVGNFSFQYRKAFTGTSVRQLELLINGVQVATTDEFGTTEPDPTVYTFTVDEINEPGNVTVRIKNVGTTTTNRQTVIDNISWTAYVSSNPLFSVLPTSISNLDYFLEEGPSGSQAFVLSGTNLDGSNVTIVAPDNFEVSDVEIGTYDEAITLIEYSGVDTDIWVRLAAGLPEGNYSGEISITGGGADPVTVSVSGEVLVPPTTEVPFSTTFGVAENWWVDGLWTGYNEKSYTDGGWFFHSTEAVRGTLDESYDGSLYSFRDRGVFAVVNEFTIGGMTGFSFQLRDWMDNDGRDREIQITLDGGTSWDVLLIINKSWFNEYQVYQQFAHYFDGPQSFAPGDFQISITNGGNTNDGRINIGQFEVFDEPRPTTIFTGTGNWSDPARWSNGIPISPDTEAIIDGDATMDSNVAVEILTINSGGSVTVSSSNSLKVTGPLTNNAGVDGLVIEQGGSLINSTEGVAGAYEWSPPSYDWHFLSAPVSGLNLLGSEFLPPVVEGKLPNTFDFYLFNQLSELPWINLRGDGGLVNGGFDQEFGPGKGYLVAYSDTYAGVAPFAFSGEFNIGYVWAGLTYDSESDWAGWNLIGNPFPSGYNWGGANKDVLVDDYAYIYDGVLNTYVPRDDGFLAPGQGFFVLANGSDDIFVFADNLRVHGGAYTKSSNVEDVLRLQFGSETRHDKTTIQIIEGTSTERDRRDALKLFSLSSEMPQVFTKSSDEKRLAVNSVPEVTEESVFPIGLLVPQNGAYSISLEETSGQFESMDIFIYDHETETEVLLSDVQSHGFEATANAGDLGLPRFELRFKSIGETTRVLDPEAQLARIYSYGNMLVLEFAEVASQRILEIYDLSGRLLVSKQLENVSEFRQSLDLMPGVYVVRVSDKNQTQTERVFIQ